MAEQDQVLDRIQDFAREEHRLRERASHESLSTQERDRLRELELTLDQCWDLLRQRRARREFGLDPDDAAPRPIETVENYLE